MLTALLLLLARTKGGGVLLTLRPRTRLTARSCNGGARGSPAKSSACSESSSRDRRSCRSTDDARSRDSALNEGGPEGYRGRE
jgi:hypothetical protein